MNLSVGLQPYLPSNPALRPDPLLLARTDMGQLVGALGARGVTTDPWSSLVSLSGLCLVTCSKPEALGRHIVLQHDLEGEDGIRNIIRRIFLFLLLFDG